MKIMKIGITNLKKLQNFFKNICTNTIYSVIMYTVNDIGGYTSYHIWPENKNSK